ncbi:pyruvate decarboxylase 2, partial [Tanacetum coccineum]
VTAHDVSTMLRGGQNPIIFLTNNRGYTIEVEIHDGPYKVINNSNYTGLVYAIHNGEGKLLISSYSEISENDYLDPRTAQVGKVDHVRKALKRQYFGRRPEGPGKLRSASRRLASLGSLCLVIIWVVYVDFRVVNS